MSRTSIGLDSALRAYLLSVQPPEHEVLRAVREATDRLPNGRMQVAPEQGHLLGFLTRLIDARRVLELGTFTGYSALAIALALPPDGRLVTCEINQSWAEIGRRFWRRAGVAAKIDARIGPALVTLQRLCDEGNSPFDLIFVDADKDSYDSYYEYALRLVRTGGLIIFDNMLQAGRVADLGDDGPRTRVIRQLNLKIARDERVDRAILPVGDGMTIARRRQSRI